MTYFEPTLFKEHQANSAHMMDFRKFGYITNARFDVATDSAHYRNCKYEGCGMFNFDGVIIDNFKTFTLVRI